MRIKLIMTRIGDISESPDSIFILVCIDPSTTKLTQNANSKACHTQSVRSPLFPSKKPSSQYEKWSCRTSHLFATILHRVSLQHRVGP